MDANRFKHETCHAIRMDKIPADVMDRLLRRQEDASTLKFSLDPYRAKDTWEIEHGGSWTVLLIFVVAIELLFAGVGVPASEIVVEVIEIFCKEVFKIHGEVEDAYFCTIVFYLFCITGLAVNEFLIRKLWREKHNPLKNQTFMTPMYLVNVTPYKVDFYPLAAIKEVSATDWSQDVLVFLRVYTNTTISIDFNDGTSFSYSFNNTNTPGEMGKKLMEYIDMFSDKLQENDQEWLDSMDDFRTLYDKPELLKKTKSRFWDKVDVLLILSNVILAVIMAICIKMKQG